MALVNENKKDKALILTRILDVEAVDNDLGYFQDRETLDHWITQPNEKPQISNLYEVAEYLRNSRKHHQLLPVAFPTETVYGLGADATNSDAVKGIYKAKGRPSDNPLIIHVCDLNMLREVIRPGYVEKTSIQVECNENHLATFSPREDPIPNIYKPLIKRFWPGPLTILLPNAINSLLAPEVTAGLSTFGARMPDSCLALSLISLTGKPLAAPSANASTKPSPTTAEHVLHDLCGKIEIIVKGREPCTIGLESTVVDGLCYPPVILRPGGIDIDLIRECPGWENVCNAYQDEKNTMAGCSKIPRAPGMKYKHYSPKAQVILYESSSMFTTPGEENMANSHRLPNIQLWQTFSFMDLKNKSTNENPSHLPPLPSLIGIIRTKNWAPWGGINGLKLDADHCLPKRIGQICNIQPLKATLDTYKSRQGQFWQILGLESHENRIASSQYQETTAITRTSRKKIADVIEIFLGADARQIAHGLFAALREMDEREVQVIFVEGIDDIGDMAVAVMNRLRKAASMII
ncbi:Threonylcarbamoyl-AMP synthase [Golovinomyces cichoracearum]|uniref:Threonylcarbamoyl-AMP synthase n=1 Tax=Golovinomyces cichoracearum TaxID=62708 RepID=A0A420IK84_9PEZI|nr:Threonylcarbamoyl-AMP synthase [Golovinomyces cichoracearum]